MFRGFGQLFGLASDATLILNISSATYTVPEYTIRSTVPAQGPGTLTKINNKRVIPGYIGVHNDRSSGNVTLTLSDPLKYRGLLSTVWALSATSSKKIVIKDDNTTASADIELDAVNEYATFISDGELWVHCKTGTGIVQS